MPTRREFLHSIGRAGAALALLPSARATNSEGIVVNDVHSQLNATCVKQVVNVDSLDTLRAALRFARAKGGAVSIAGGRHAMGGQQFATDAVLLDTRSMNRILTLDAACGVVEVEAGIQWPELIDGLLHMQQGESRVWGIVQKQTGADRLSLGGALASNIHGRGLSFQPMVQDVAAFTLMDAEGELHRCSPSENAELFGLVIGGYGLFGVVTSVALRLMPRTRIERAVEIIDARQLMPAFERRIETGFVYGDCQFSTDMPSDDFLMKGVFSCYRPVPTESGGTTEHKELSEGDWRALYSLAHTDTRRAYEAYAAYYLSTNGQRYWSDTHQLSTYLDDYHKALDARLGSKTPGSEMISELYVPRGELASFLLAVRKDFRKHGVQVIYGTIRLIEKDTESFLAWAKESYACIVMNLHVEHTQAGLAKAHADFQRLIDRAIERGGSYFLTYHRWARRDQVDACYPQMAEFLKLKRRYDPRELFQSDWYRHYKAMYANKL